jgi:hypothetical protein
VLIGVGVNRRLANQAILHLRPRHICRANKKWENLVSLYHPSPWNCLSFRLVSRHQQSGTHDLRGLFADQRRGHEFSDILAAPALSIEQTHFLKVVILIA